MMWLGHASVLVQIDGLSVLTDPIFSARCSPSQMFGSKRYRDPPCTVDGRYFFVIFNPYLANEFSHHYKLDEPTFIFRGVRRDFCFHFSMKFL